MKRSLVFALALLLLLSGCGSGESPAPSQADIPPAGAAIPEIEKTDWPAVSTDAEAFDLNGSFDNPNFEYVFNHTDTVPLDQLIAFSLVADAAGEGACEELRSRFLAAPNTVLLYLALMGDQRVDVGDDPLAADAVCRFIASADAAWHDGSDEFAQTMEDCRKIYPEGRIAELLDIMAEEHEASMERNHSFE